MTIIKIDVTGETCPVPLIEFRKAVRNASSGDIIEISGTHPASKKEIPMAAESLNLKIIEVKGDDNEWKITIKK